MGSDENGKKNEKGGAAEEERREASRQKKKQRGARGGGEEGHKHAMIHWGAIQAGYDQRETKQAQGVRRGEMVPRGRIPRVDALTLIGLTLQGAAAPVQEISD